MSGSTWTWTGGTINLESPSDWTLTAGPGNRSGLPVEGDTAINSGTLAGYGIIAASIINNGLIEATNSSVPASSTGGDLVIAGAVSGTGSLTIAPGATLEIDGSLGAGQTIAFSAGAPETLILGSPTGTISNPITGFAEGDKIEFANGVTLNAVAILNSNTVAATFHNDAGSVGTYDLTDLAFPGAGVDYGNSDPITNDPYFMPERFFNWLTGSGNFATGTNWNFGTAPAALDYAGFGDGLGGTISGSGSVNLLSFWNTGRWLLAPGTSLSDSLNLEVGAGGGGTFSPGFLAIGSGSTVVSAGQIEVGTAAGSNATLTISGGGVLRESGPANTIDYEMYVGGAGSGTLAGGSGTVLVTGAGSLIDLGLNGLDLANGGGSGTLIVSQGGSVHAAATNANLNASIAIGRLGDGTLTVTDPGSEVTATGFAFIAHAGTSSLTVENSGTFLAALPPTGAAGLVIGDGSTIGVGGLGIATVSTGGNLISQGYVTVGLRGSSGELTALNGGTVQVDTTLVIGDGGTIAPGTIETGSGTLAVDAGGTVALIGTAQTSGYGIYLGDSNDGTASTENAVATVSGTGAILNANGNGISVGQYGTASLTVSQGGSVVSGTLNSNLVSALAVGRQGDGTVTVTDPGSRLSADGAAYLGRGGDGSLIVENQASVVIGLDSLGVGGLNIGGTGTNSTGTLWAGGVGFALVTSGGDLFSQANINIGRNGASGTLAVASGGTVEAGSRLLVGNDITLVAGDTLVSPYSTTAITSPTVENGYGVVTIGAGSVLKVDSTGITTTGTSAVLIGNGAGDSGLVEVAGAGAILNAGSNWIDIGNSGTGELDVSQGGSVTAGVLGTADAATVLGNEAGSTGLLNVSAGATYDAVGQVDVGVNGYGDLQVYNDGTLLSGNNPDPAVLGFTIGWGALSSGAVTVTEAGSKIVNVGHFVVGGSGNAGNPAGGYGSLLIQAGGVVQTSMSASSIASPAAAIAADPGTDGSNVNVTGAGSSWQIGGALDVGDAAAGSLSITNGASVSASTLDAGIQGGSTGVITVSGTNAALTTTGSLSVGDGGSGELAILNGANVFIGGDFDIGQTAGGSGNVDIEDATGTVFVGGNLNLGAGGPAVLTVGPTSTLEVDNGGITGGPDGVLNLYTSIDPIFDDGGPTINVLKTQTQDFPAYTANQTFNISQGATYTLDTPVIYGTTTFSLGTASDTESAELILNAGSISNQAVITFNNAIDTLVIGDNALGTIDTPASGTSGFTKEANPDVDAPLIGGFSGKINNFAAGDQIVVDTPAGATFSQSGSVVSVIEDNVTIGTLTFASAQMAQTAASTQGALTDTLLCFLAGTLITTPTGRMEVERLAVGDMVLTMGGGVRPITWIGVGRVLATRGRRTAATPVIVRKGAFGPNVPYQDLHVTKGHSFFVDDVLIPVEFLVNHRSILWDDRAQEVSIYHIELETHDVLLANGAAAESYRDDGNRWLFQNASTGWDMAPKPPCAPVLTGGPIVDAAWRRLLDRAGPRPSVPLTDDPDLHLVVNGVRVDAATRTDDVSIFNLAGPPDSLHVVSRAAVPQELGIARDPRLLGVALQRVIVRQGTRFRVTKAADDGLAEGFHPFEASTGLRWTDGDALLPGAATAGFQGPIEVVVHLGGTTRYIDDGVSCRRVA